jgi:hypothetical protein
VCVCVGGGRSIAALILYIGTGGGGELLTSCPDRFNSWKETPYTLNMRVGGLVGGRRVSVDVMEKRTTYVCLSPDGIRIQCILILVFKELI